MECVIDARFSSRVERTERVIETAESFGLGLEEKDFVIYDNLRLDVQDGDIVYITGQSGSGKSLCLRKLAEQLAGHGKRVMSLDDVELLDVPLVDQIGKDLNDAMRLMSMAGVNDAYLFVRKPSELSDGQRYRFKLAKLIEGGADVWVADEFGAVLDRETAKIVAFNVQRIARKAGAIFIAATTHTDLADYLKPDLQITKHYKDRVEVKYES